MSLNTSQIQANESSKLKLDYMEPKNSYILLINVINFKLRLIKFVYIFETSVIFEDRRERSVHIYWTWCDIILNFKLHRRTRLTPQSSIYSLKS